MAETGLSYTSESNMKRWRAIRDEIHAQVCEHGYNASLGAFTQYYGSDTLDAAVLHMSDTGFLPHDDPRVVSTVQVIKRVLTDDGLVLRYSQPRSGMSVDGLPGSEGAFLACSFWLVNALRLIGEADELELLFPVHRLVPFAGREALARLDLDEHQRPAAPHDEVDLPAAQPHVAPDHRVPTKAVEPCGAALAECPQLRHRDRASEDHRR